MLNQDKIGFINDGNLILEKPEFSECGASTYGFLVPCDKEALQKVLDTNFNSFNNSPYHYQPLLSKVLLTFNSIAHAESLDPEHTDYGYITELEVIPWIIVGQFIEKNGESHLDQIYFYPYLCFIDSSLALITGRELYGYPKYIGHTKMPASIDETLSFSLTVKSYKEFSNDTLLQDNPLIDINLHQASKKESSNWTSFSDGLEQLKDQIESDVKKTSGHLHAILETLKNADLNLYKQLFNTLLEPSLNQLFLKQFPDATGNYAVYQAITNAPAVVEKFYSGKCFFDQFEIEFHPNASFPLATNLGISLTNNKIIVDGGFYVHFDFLVKTAQEIIVNTPTK